MLPQTNLQLYGQLIRDGWSDAALARTRRAYDLVRQLFSDAYRPSHKPFVCHLVGTAGALATWKADRDLVIAGMLHSAYLYGEFGDGDEGPTPRRRALVRQLVGEHVEQIVFDYTRSRSAGSCETSDRTIALLRLADRLDELCDAGPRFAIAKPIGQDKQASAWRHELLAEADDLVGALAVEMFREAIRLGESLTPGDSLTTADRSFHRVSRGIPQLRRNFAGRRVLRLKQKIKKRLVA